MNLSSAEMLRRLGAGEKIAAVCEAAGVSRPEFDAWWRRETESRLPAMNGSRPAAVSGAVRIERDAWGIPHVFAENDRDLFFGFGYAVAQDRLFQLDYLRRKGSGRLSEVLGPASYELDLLARTVGLRRIAEAEWHKLPDESHKLLSAWSDGVNALMEETRDRLPIEFGLLDYRPAPWSPLDCLTIEVEFRWYLTGRFPVIVMPELARRALGDGPLYKAFLTRESDSESIVPPGSYPPANSLQPVGTAAGDPDAGTGSNNWVVAGSRAADGKPLVASDPHIAFEAVSCWHEVHLAGGSFNVAGMSYVGIPAVMFGRNKRVAWGCTNNICSQRDLYLEKTDSAHPGCYLHGADAAAGNPGQWLPERQLEEWIEVKGGEAVREVIRFSPNGPIVNRVLPAPARGGEPVSLKWLGAYQGGWLTALLGMDRARSADELRQAMRPWHVPTFCVVFADVEGRVGYQATGRVPMRNLWERGYRPGWEAAHQWAGLVPFEGMPALSDPPQGFIATANHRPAPDDYPYPLSGTWSDDLRAKRIRQMIESQPKLDRAAFGAMHQDALSLRAVNLVPHLLAVLKRHIDSDSRLPQAVEFLERWDCRMEPESTAAAIFEVFFAQWIQRVAKERFNKETAALLSAGISGLSAALLVEDACGWFKDGNREQAIVATFNPVLDWLMMKFEASMPQWKWGGLHTLPLKHVLGTRGELGELLNHGGPPVRGNLNTVCNTSPSPTFEVLTGAGYRLIAELGSSPPGLWAVDAQSQSGHPGSPHYRDQLDDWIGGRYHYLPLDPAEAGKVAVEKRTLIPG